MTPGRTTEPSALSRAGLTTRAAVLGLVVCGLVVSAALPLREYLAQRGAIAEADASLAAARARVAALEGERARLQDPAQVAAEARRRLHFVRPGEIAYTLVLPTPAPTNAPTADRPVGVDAEKAPWYSQLYGSVRAADAPAPAPPAPAATRK